ncbi:TPA: hypothetical protein RG646_RS01720 [Providencia rettgeri]|nr:hypothetical protein [Providencia rettgeri]
MNTLMDKNHGDIIIAFTNSWRYLATGSILSFICQFSLFLCLNYNKYYLFIAIIIFIISHYYIYRLWLDNHFFKIIYHQENTKAFDNTLTFLFPRKTKGRSMEQRWYGTKQLFTRALLSVLLLWLWLLITVVTL